jgi:hypothetical protein
MRLNQQTKNKKTTSDERGPSKALNTKQKSRLLSSGHLGPDLRRDPYADATRRLTEFGSLGIPWV